MMMVMMMVMVMKRWGELCDDMRLLFFENTFRYVQKKKKKKNIWTMIKEITEKERWKMFWRIDWALFQDVSHCVEGEGITWLGIVDVGVIVVAQESFLGISVSGVGISWPVIVSGTIGGGGTDLLLATFAAAAAAAVESGLLAASLPWALATL